MSAKNRQRRQQNALEENRQLRQQLAFYQQAYVTAEENKQTLLTAIEGMRAQLRGEDTQVAWTPFEKTAVERHAADLVFTESYVNSRYQVMARQITEANLGNDNILRHFTMPESFYPLTHLSIKRVDQTSYVSWRDLQRIKNEICGTDCEGIQLNPAESRLVDTANQYHLWVLPAGTYWPVGWATRVVSQTSDIVGVVQDNWEDDASRPVDLVHIDSIQTMRTAAQIGRLKKIV